MTVATTKLDVRLFIRGCSAQDLDEFITSINARRTVLDGEAQLAFRRGDAVEFDSGRRGRIQGTVESHVRGGRFEVREARTSLLWRVAGSVLRPWTRPVVVG